MSKKLIYFVLVLGLAAGFASAQSVKINFQELGGETPEGYLPDGGEVFSGDHDDAVANWTLPAGTYTLEIAYREDGALLDIIVISKID